MTEVVRLYKIRHDRVSSEVRRHVSVVRRRDVSVAWERASPCMARNPTTNPEIWLGGTFRGLRPVWCLVVAFLADVRHVWECVCHAFSVACGHWIRHSETVIWFEKVCLVEK